MLRHVELFTLREEKQKVWRHLHNSFLELLAAQILINVLSRNTEKPVKVPASLEFKPHQRIYSVVTVIRAIKCPPFILNIIAKLREFYITVLFLLHLVVMQFLIEDFL